MNGKSKKADYRAADSAELSSGYAKRSKKETRSARGLVIFAAALVFAADVFALTWMLFQKLSYPYILFPSLLIAADGLFLLFAVFTNFRFRYSKVLLWCYFLAAAVLSALFLREGSVAEKTYFSYIGIFIFILPHILMWFALWWTSRLARNPSFRKRRAATVAAIALAAVSVAGFGLLRAEFGTFGQNDTAERAVVYRLNEAEDAYIAAEVLNGRGDTVTLEETFNGKPVEGVDCALFEDKTIQKVNLKSGEKLKLYNLELLRNRNTELDVTVNRAVLNDLQTQIFDKALSYRDNLIGGFLQQTVPDVKESETFVTFAYDFETLPTEAKAIPVYIGEKNAVFSASHLGAVYQNLYERRGDLSWNYYSNGKQRLKTFETESGGSFLVETSLSKSVRNVKVAFERVYAVERDYGKYNYGGVWASSLYATETEFDGCLDYDRAGCTVKWNVAAQGVNSAVISTEKEFSEFLSAAGDAASVRLTAEWQVIKPQIEVRSDAEQNTFIYGDDVAVSAQAKPHALKTIYKLISSDGESVIEDWKDEALFSLSGLLPKQSGNFTVVARAVDAYDARLYSEETKQIALTVKKKVLDFDWVLPQNAEYDGSVKNVVARNRAEQLVGGDTIGYDLSETVRNAKTYHLYVVLVPESAEKYEVSELTGSAEYTVTPKAVQTVWSGTEFVYNGLAQIPEASARGVASDGWIEIRVTGGEKNAGEYIAEATTPNTNYRLENEKQPFQISKRALVAVWSGTSLRYNGRGQHPVVTELTNVVEGEFDEIVSKIILSGGNAVNVGKEYAVSATLPDDTNYCFESAQGIVYDITEAPLILKANDAGKIYDGKTFAEFSVTVKGLVGSDILTEVLEAGYLGDAVTAIAAGEYTVTPDVRAAEKFGNYSVTLENGVLKISARPITVAAEAKSKFYDNKQFEDFTVTVENLAEGDALSDVGTVSFEGDALTAVDASDRSYRYSPKIEAQDEGAKFGNYGITYRESFLTISKKEIRVVAFGGEKTYDGNPFTAFRYETGAFAEGDTLANVAVLDFGGAAVGETNAGSYAVTAKVASEGLKYHNYTFVFEEGRVVISPKSLAVTGKNAEKTYDNKRYEFGENDYEVTGLAATDSLSEVLTVAFAGEAVTGSFGGNYNYMLTLDEERGKYRNYDVTFVGAELSIRKRKVVVSAENLEKIYDGKAFAAFSVSAELAEGDTLAVLGTVTYTGEAVTAVNASKTPYAYLPQIKDEDKGAKFDDCYDVEFASATLTINKREASVTAISGGKIYDGTGYGAFSAQALNLAEGETTELLGNLVFGGEAVTAKDAGSYSLTVSIQDATAAYENYVIRFISGTITISPRTLTLKKTGEGLDIRKTYDGTTECEFAFSYGTHFAIDDADAVSGEITGAEILSKRFNGANVFDASKVTVTFGALLTGENYKAENYRYASGQTLEYTAAIDAFEANVNWSNTEATYTGKAQKPTAEATGIDRMPLPLTVTVDGNADGVVNAALYSAEARCSDRNYTLFNKSHRFTITPSEAEVQWSSETEYVYSGAEMLPEARVTGVNGETVIVTVTVISGSADGKAIDVGTYTAAAETQNRNYVLKNTEREFKIVPKTVAVVWKNLTAEYNGFDRIPTATALLAAGETPLEVSFTDGGAKKDAGTYDVSATLADGNYILTETTAKFVIAPKTVAVIWDGSAEYVFDGEAHEPRASAEDVNGALLSLNVTITFGETVVSTAVNEGRYVVSVTCSDPNYVLTDAEFGFEIVPPLPENVLEKPFSSATEGI